MQVSVSQVGARRGQGYNDERDQTLNQLLTELDGFEGRPGEMGSDANCATLKSEESG